MAIDASRGSAISTTCRIDGPTDVEKGEVNLYSLLLTVVPPPEIGNGPILKTLSRGFRFPNGWLNVTVCIVPHLHVFISPPSNVCNSLIASERLFCRISFLVSGWGVLTLSNQGESSFSSNWLVTRYGIAPKNTKS